MSNYFLQKTNPLNIFIDPPKPNIGLIGNGSRWINITWEIVEVAYIESFDIFINNTRLETLNNANFSVNQTRFFRNYTEADGITPFKRQVNLKFALFFKNLCVLFSYEFSVKLNSNHNELSEPLVVTTLQEGK